MRWAAPLLLLLLALLSVGGWTACAAAENAVAAKIVVASDLDNLPFAGVDDDGAPIGRDVEMMAQLAARMGVVLEWRRMPFDRLLAEVEAGRVDVVCATIGVTPERAQRVAFTRPYFETDIAVVVRAGAGSPTMLAHLNNKRVAAGAGTTSERAARLKLPDAILVHEAKTDRSIPDQLVLQQLDAAVMDGPAADRMVERSNGLLRRMAPTLARESYALVAPPNRPRLLRRLDAALAQLQRDGVLAALDRSHGLTNP